MTISLNAGNSLELEIPKCENSQDWTISRKGIAMYGVFDDLAYYYGVFLGDGFVSNGYVQIKAIDKEFVECWRDCVKRLFGKEYSLYYCKPESDKRQPLWICKMYGQDKVDHLTQVTHMKSEIPNYIKDGSKNVKLSFIQGLMDSEGWVYLSISPLKSSNIGLAFANTASWTKDLHYIFKEVGIKTSDIVRRKFNDGRKDLFTFKIDVNDYVDCGLGFNIPRKQRRLDFVARILNDYTRNYKGKNYTDSSTPVEDIVCP
jgi:intein/homing endonuclease